jgi:acetylornithine deacetylase/succinyl-diaminopimelate desuccinylase-like protein
VAKVPTRPNAIVQWGEGEKGFAFIGHMDTVAPGDAARWSTDPFGAEVRDGRLYGRGAADNKAGIACALYTIALLHRSGLLDPQRHQLLLAGVVDEESGATSPLGVRYLLDTGALAAAQGAIYTYASDIVCVGHRGLLRLTLNARGQAVHTGSEDWATGRSGVNAVTGLAAALLALEELELLAPTHPAFAHLGCTVTPGTLFSGGEFESIVPGEAQALVDIRLMPGQDPERVIRAVQKTLTSVCAKRVGLQIKLAVKNQLPGAAISSEHPLVQIAQETARRQTGDLWPIAGAGPANEGYMLINAGIPTLCGFGPKGGGAHAPDEWVDIDSLADTVAIYSRILLNYHQ